LARAGVSPTTITLVGLVLNVASGVLAGLGHAPAAGGVLLVASACDALDGQLARRTGRTSRFGAFLDSSVDRIDETAVLAGIAAYFQRSHTTHAELLVVATVLALAGSLITSYARARAEGLGLECKVGAFERPERVAVVIAGLLFGQMALAGAVLVVLVLSWFTVLQRIEHVRRLLRPLEQPPQG
jgi:CDP-diacylglycerol--glycerol-3-phosphate 3-phosphatidyltransferase